MRHCSHSKKFKILSRGLRNICVINNNCFTRQQIILNKSLRVPSSVIQRSAAWSNWVDSNKQVYKEAVLMYASTSAMYRCYFSSFQPFFFISSHSVGMRRYHMIDLICISLTTNDVEQLGLCLSVSWISF